MKNLTEVVQTTIFHYGRIFSSLVLSSAFLASCGDTKINCETDQDCVGHGFCNDGACEEYQQNSTDNAHEETPYHEEDTEYDDRRVNPSGSSHSGDRHQGGGSIPARGNNHSSNSYDGGTSPSGGVAPNGQSGEWQSCDGNETRTCGTCDYGTQRCETGVWQACDFTPPQTDAQHCGCSIVVSTMHSAGVLFILDASGSMSESYPGGTQSKYVVAKNAIETVLQSYHGQMNFGLHIFGTDQCTTPIIQVPIGSDPSLIQQTLQAYGPLGGTPLAFAITTGTTELQRYRQQSPQDNLAAIILSDGGETCSGNPLGAVTNMVGQGITPYLVDSSNGQLAAIANALNHQGSQNAYAVTNASQLVTALHDIIGQLVVQVSYIEEVCNGIDDDCDGLIDENLTWHFYTGTSSTSGVGVCRPGIKECINGSYQTTTPEIIPTDELCDGLDNDCDGMTDEDYYVGTACAFGTKPCVFEGQIICSPDGRSAVCSSTLPGQEVCDGYDNDCDGTIDNISLVGKYITLQGEELLRCLGLSSLSWSPRADRFLFEDPFRGIYVVNTDGTNLVKVIQNNSPQPSGVELIRDPSWLDEDTIIYVSETIGSGDSQSTINAYTITTGETRELFRENDPGYSSIEIPSLSPDASMVAFRYILNDTYQINIFNLLRGGEPQNLSGLDVLYYNIPLIWSPDSESVFFSDGRPARLYKSEIATGQRLEIAGEGSFLCDLSPDGSKLLYDWSNETILRDLTTHQDTFLREIYGRRVFGRWSPEGSQLARPAWENESNTCIEITPLPCNLRSAPAPSYSQNGVP